MGFFVTIIFKSVKRDTKYLWVYLSATFVFILFLSVINENRIIVKLKYPTSKSLKLNDVWCLSQINNNTNNSYPVYLHGIVSVNNKENWLWDAVTSTFSFPAEFSANSISISKLKPIKGIFNPQQKRLEDSINKTGVLPVGTYIFCIYIVEKSTSRELAHDCIQITKEKAK